MLILSFLTGPPRTLMGLTHDDIRRTLSIGSDNDPFDYSSSPFPCPPDLDPYAIDKLELPGSPTVQFDNFLGGHIRPAKHEHHDIFNFTEDAQLLDEIALAGRRLDNMTSSPEVPNRQPKKSKMKSFMKAFTFNKS